jgi:ADP-ribosylglycohydrolase
MSTLASIHDRIRGSIWGQFVGDAAALGTHWIYDLSELAGFKPGGVTGFEAPRPGHYHQGKQPGDQTHYGDAALLLLESMAECGRFDDHDFGTRFVEFFNDPDCRSYKDHATRDTLKNHAANPRNFQNGADDNQGSSVTRLAPVVAAYHHASDDVLEKFVIRATKVTQNNPEAVGFNYAHALVLRALLDGNDMVQAVDQACESAPCDVTDYMEAASTMLMMNVADATEHFGQSCPLTQCFPAALQCAMKQSDDFAACIRETLKAGGDNAARSSLIGAWLGALHGIHGVPESWRERLTENERIHAAVERIVSFAV